MLKKQVFFTKKFRKNMMARFNNTSVIGTIKEKIDLFISNRSNPILCDHKLQGKLKAYRSFSVTGDIRIIYQETDIIFLFLDIGTHNQVYE